MEVWTGHGQAQGHGLDLGWKGGLEVLLEHLATFNGV